MFVKRYLEQNIITKTNQPPSLSAG